MRFLVSLVLFLALALPAAGVSPYRQVPDLNYQITNSDYFLGTLPITAARTWTLPSANTTCIASTATLLCPSRTLEVLDVANTITSSNTITIVPSAGETINGSSAGIVISSPGTRLILWPTSTNSWIAAPGPVISGNISLTSGSTIGNPAIGYISLINLNSPWAVSAECLQILCTYADNTLSIRNNTYTTTAKFIGTASGSALTVSSVTSGTIHTNDYLLCPLTCGSNTNFPQLVQITGGGPTNYTLSQSVGSSTGSVAFNAGSQLGNASIRFQCRDGSECGALYMAPNYNGNINIEGGSIIAGDTSGRGTGFVLTYNTGLAVGGALPTGYQVFPYQVTKTGDWQLNTSNGTTNIDLLHQVAHVFMKGGTGATQGYVGFGVSTPAGSPTLNPLFPVHVMGQQLVVDNDGAGTNTIWLNDNGTPMLGTNQSSISLVTGSNTPGSATVRGTIGSTGLNIINGYSSNGAAGVDCPAGITAGTVTVSKGIVTHC